MKPSLLFLGSQDSPVYLWLQEQGHSVLCADEPLTLDFFNRHSIEFIVSYGYRHIIKKEVLDLFPNKAVNLHISYLPYNRGADPNFWSFIQGTPSGVTIHYIDPGVDTGNIIVQKKVDFPNIEQQTLASTYSILHTEIQLLFFKHWASIYAGTCANIPQKGEGTVHKTKDKQKLNHLLEEHGWDTKVIELIEYGEYSAYF